MKNSIKFMLILGFVSAFSLDAQAATFSAVGQTGSCLDSSQVSTGVAAAACLTNFAQGSSAAGAFSGNGTLGGSASVVIFDGTGQGFSSTIHSAGFGASYSDALTFNVISGTLIIPFDIQGSVRGNSAINASSGVFGVSTTTQTVFDSSSSTGQLGVTNVAMPFSNSTLNLNVSISGSVNCTGGADVGGILNTSCSSIVDFGSTVRLLGAQILDENGLLVGNFSITSESGFDYVAGAEPHGVSAVPLPAGFVLLLSGLAGITGLKRMKKLTA